MITPPSVELASKSHSWSGQFFLTFDASGALERQGQILGSPQPGYYLCQLRNWITGDVSERVLVPVAEVAAWRLYPTEQQWRAAADVLSDWNSR